MGKKKQEGNPKKKKKNPPSLPREEKKLRKKFIKIRVAKPQGDRNGKTHWPADEKKKAAKGKRKLGDTNSCLDNKRGGGNRLQGAGAADTETCRSTGGSESVSKKERPGHETIPLETRGGGKRGGKTKQVSMPREKAPAKNPKHGRRGRDHRLRAGETSNQRSVGDRELGGDTWTVNTRRKRDTGNTARHLVHFLGHLKKGRASG